MSTRPRARLGRQGRKTRFLPRKLTRRQTNKHSLDPLSYVVSSRRTAWKSRTDEERHGGPGAVPAIRVLRCVGWGPETKRQSSRRQAAGTEEHRTGLCSIATAPGFLEWGQDFLFTVWPLAPHNRHRERRALRHRGKSGRRTSRFLAQHLANAPR